ncbi:MAG TPA: YihY/virulence factor BrkB family protein [Caulobacteraceae bacterium]|nr:YihY/virulence factor BrkB family protein [Caulobacteraceae bacterium]
MRKRETPGRPRSGKGQVLGLAAAFVAGAVAPAVVWRCADSVLDAFRSSSGPSDFAGSPLRISRRGWIEAVSHTIREFSEDRILAVAAGAAFYNLLALFPALGAFVSLYGLVADLDQARAQLMSLSSVLPGGAISILSQQLTRLGSSGHASLGLAFASGLLISIVSSNAGMKALISGLNVAYDEHEKRNFLELNAVSLAFTIGFIVFSVIAIAAVVAAPELLRRLGLGAGVGAITLLKWPLLLVVLIGLFSVLYRYGPSREHARWRWITPGGVAAAIGWLAMSLLFSWYVANFGHYDRTYGSLGAVIGFMTWIWLSLIVILFGAELNSALELETLVDTTTGPQQPPGRRGAFVANHKTFAGPTIPPLRSRSPQPN